ncbi:hypothetical protein ACKFR8_10560 [Corynebacterium axilliensis]|uniref:hypothetical protein n=1 Tax=Corynebacterium sp. YSMAA5_1_F9 TaxID=3383591 RepID=UPI0038D0A1AD
MRHSVVFLSIATTGVTASLVLTGCSTDEDTSPQPSAPATTTLSTVSALNDWQPESLPQPVTRLGTTAPSAPDSPEPEPERKPETEAEQQPEQPPQNTAPAPQVQTVTVQAPAPKPAPQNPPKAPKQPQPQNPRPGLPALPAPPTIHIPQEVQDGIDQNPHPSPAPAGGGHLHRRALLALLNPEPPL